MRASKRIFTWIIVSLILQCSVYFYLNNFYFSPEGSIKFTQMNTSDKKNIIKPNVTFLSSDDNISLNDNFSYTASMTNGIVKVIDTSTGEKRNITFASGVKCLAYKWVPDTNRMVIAEELYSSKGRKVIKFFYYDAEKQEKAEIYNYESKLENSMPVGESVDFQISELTGVLYAKISYSKVLASIYRLDRNETLTRVSTVTRNIGNISVAANNDQLLYEDLAYGGIHSNYEPRSTVKLNKGSSVSILGSDDDDNFYLGLGKSTINKIYYGKLTENTSQWKEISLDNSVDINNIIISPDNNVYVVDRDQGTVLNVKNNKTTKFKGTFIELNNDSIISKVDNKLTIKSF